MPTLNHPANCPSTRLRISAILAIVVSMGGTAPATTAAAPSEGDLAQLCAVHGRDCQCPGCRAYFHACEQPCPSEGGPGIPAEAPPEGLEMAPGEMAPGELSPEAMGAEAGPAPLSGSMPSLSSMGAVAAATSAAPSMIGDFFGAGYNYALSSDADGATVGVAGGDRLLKFSDNNSPIPQDRLFFNYHHFQDSVVDVNGDDQDTDRFTFGLERTMWDGLASIEVRVPFTASVDATQEDESADTLAAEFGNVALAVKALVMERGPWSVGAGLGMIFPTADDSALFNDDGDLAVTFSNDAYYLQPFLGLYFLPNDRLFTQFVTQVNFDVHGNVVTVEDGGFFNTNGSFADGDSDRIYQQSLLFLDYSVGYWCFRERGGQRWLTGVAPMVELHYATTMEDLELPNIDADVFEPDFRRDVLNITGGVLLEIGPLTSLKLAGVAPLRGGTDRIFDSEFGLQLIRRY